MKCSECNGSGIEPGSINAADDGNDCFKCEGTGKFPPEKKSEPSCESTCEKLQKARSALIEYESEMKQIGGCSDGDCLVSGRTSGMHTNGGCKCWMDRAKSFRIICAANRMRKALDAIK